MFFQLLVSLVDWKRVFTDVIHIQEFLCCFRNMRYETYMTVPTLSKKLKCKHSYVYWFTVFKKAIVNYNDIIIYKLTHQ